MNDKIQKRLADLKARQRAGEHMKCPRCSADTMKPDVYTNALSRLTDIMICSDCGLAEAKLAYMRVHETLYSWAAFQPEIPTSDYKKRNSVDVRQELEETQLPYLIALYKRVLSRSEDINALRYECYETCRGLSELSFEPFYAVYDVSDGRLVIRFRRSDADVLYAISLIARKQLRR